MPASNVWRYQAEDCHPVELVLQEHSHCVERTDTARLPYWSLSQYLKHKVKSAVSYVTQFEEAVAAEAKRRGHDGVVCGHIHRAELRTINGTLYANDGDWVESLSALVEHADGHLEVVHWPHGHATLTPAIHQSVTSQV